MSDIILTCLCGASFTFTEGEQKFYESKGYQTPKRCLNCRREKKKADPQRQTFGEPSRDFIPEQPIRKDWRRERHNRFRNKGYRPYDEGGEY